MKLLVLGIGNVLLGDEGIGVLFVKWFEHTHEIVAQDGVSVDFVDGGTLCMQLTPIIAGYDRVIVVDCIDGDAQCGDVFWFDYGRLPLGLNHQGSAHEVETFAMLNFMDLCGDLPRTSILAVKPRRIGIKGNIQTSASNSMASEISFVGSSADNVKDKITQTSASNDITSEISFDMGAKASIHVPMHCELSDDMLRAADVMARVLVRELAALKIIARKICMTSLQEFAKSYI